MHIVMTGSREWTDIELIRVGLMRASRVVHNAVKLRPSEITLIHGNARGADTLAHTVAIEWGWNVGVYEAEWSKHGKAAGGLRNQRMIDEEDPLVCAAFLIPELPCRGTRDMMERCYKAGIPVVVTPGAKHR
jgi:hypothetical protein